LKQANKLKYLPKSHDEFPELLLARGDLLFNRTNSTELVGKTAVSKDTPQPCPFATRMTLCCYAASGLASVCHARLRQSILQKAFTGQLA
jgi:hypothetical protein